MIESWTPPIFLKIELIFRMSSESKINYLLLVSAPLWMRVSVRHDGQWSVSSNDSAAIVSGLRTQPTA